MPSWPTPQPHPIPDAATLAAREALASVVSGAVRAAKLVTPPSFALWHRWADAFLSNHKPADHTQAEGDAVDASFAVCSSDACYSAAQAVAFLEASRAYDAPHVPFSIWRSRWEQFASGHAADAYRLSGVVAA